MPGWSEELPTAACLYLLLLQDRLSPADAEVLPSGTGGTVDLGSSTALPCAHVLVVPAGDKMLIGREIVCKSRHLWASAWGGKWSWAFSLYFDLACGSCSGWEAEPEFWCFLGKVPNVKKANWSFSLWSCVSCECSCGHSQEGRGEGGGGSTE